MVLELQPPQPDAVRRALERLLVESASPSHPDPWWLAGVEAAHGDGVPAQPPATETRPPGL